MGARLLLSQLRPQLDVRGWDPHPHPFPSDLEPIAIRDKDLVAPVIDFSIPRRVRPTFGLVSYAQLKSGYIVLNGRKVRTAPLVSLRRSMQVAEILKQWIASGQFTLTQPVAPLPLDREFLTQNPYS
jgi:uncharacterized protein (DUF39 family)